MFKLWIIFVIKIFIDRKNKLYKKYLKIRLLYLYLKFKFYRNKLNYFFRISKRMYYNDFFNNNINNMKNIWKGIRQIINFNLKFFYVLIKIIKDNIELVDGKFIVDVFNDFFVNIGSKLVNFILLVFKLLFFYLFLQKFNSFYFLLVIFNEIE